LVIEQSDEMVCGGVYESRLVMQGVRKREQRSVPWRRRKRLGVTEELCGRPGEKCTAAECRARSSTRDVRANTKPSHRKLARADSARTSSWGSPRWVIARAGRGVVARHRDDEGEPGDLRDDLEDDRVDGERGGPVSVCEDRDGVAQAEAVGDNDLIARDFAGGDVGDAEREAEKKSGQWVRR